MDSDDDQFYPTSAPSRGLGVGGRSLDFQSGGIDRPDPSGIVSSGRPKDRGYGDRIAQYDQADKSKKFNMDEDRTRGRGRPNGGDDGPIPALYSIQRGRVVKLEDFGAFIEMEGFGRKHGLIHRSQLSNYKVDKPSDVLDMNDPVFVKVVSLDKDDTGRTKIGLSMKYCDQSKGTDLDPNQSALTTDQARRAAGGKGNWEPDPIKASDAMRSAVCRRCGGKGHIATECFSQVNKPAAEATGSDEEPAFSMPSKPAYKQYDLIPSDDEKEMLAASAMLAERAKKKDDKKRKRDLLERMERGEKVEPGDMDEALMLLKKKKKKKEKKDKKERKKEPRKKDKDEKKKSSSKRRESYSDSQSSSGSSDFDRDRHARKDRERKRSASPERRRARSPSPRRRSRSPSSRYRRSPSPTPESRYRGSGRSGSRPASNERRRSRSRDRRDSRDRGRDRR